MARTLAQYDPEKVIATWAPLPASGFGSINILEGAAADAFIAVALNAPRWSKSGDRAGNQTRVKNNDRSGTVTVTLFASSPLNSILSKAAAADDLSENVVGTITIKDLNGDTVIKATGAYLVDSADPSYGAEVGTRTWVWECTEIIKSLGGHDVL